MRKSLFVFVGLGLLVLGGCDGSKAIDNFGDKMVAAAGQIDPLALKKILDSRDSWEEKANKLEQALDGAKSEKGAINLATGGAYIITWSPSGDFVEKISIDDEKEPMAQYVHFLDWNGTRNHWADRGSNDQLELSLDPNLRTTGTHTITVFVRPQGASVWSFSLSLARKLSNGDFDKVRTYNLGSNYLDPGQVIVPNRDNKLIDFPVHVIFTQTSPSVPSVR